MFGIEYRWGNNGWEQFGSWYKSKKTRDESIEILRERFDRISNHQYRPIERVH